MDNQRAGETGQVRTFNLSVVVTENCPNSGRSKRVLEFVIAEDKDKTEIEELFYHYWETELG